VNAAHEPTRVLSLDMHVFLLLELNSFQLFFVFFSMLHDEQLFGVLNVEIVDCLCG
jgi:hypothetical protein